MQMSPETQQLAEQSYQNCIGCKACMKGCPMLHLFCENPKELLRDLAEQGTFEKDLPYSCMLCRYCTAVCPKGVDIRSVMFALRRDAARVHNDKLPASWNFGAISTHQKLSFSPLVLRKPVVRGDTAFFPGCGLQAYSPPLVRKVHRFLSERLGGVGFVNACCGKPTQYLGLQSPYEKIRSDLSEMFSRAGIRKVITGCQNCFVTLREQGDGLQVESLYKVLSELEPEKHFTDRVGAESGKWTLHDPCPTRFHPEIHEGVRRLLSVSGMQWEEMPNAGKRTLCCGAGGAVSLCRPDVSGAHMERRAQEASTPQVVTYCQECVESMRTGGKKAVHILDILFDDALPEDGNPAPRLLKKWAHRIGMRIDG